jgi:transcriptional regulator with XRE-family HTH domain
MMDDMSTMTDDHAASNRRLAARVRALRDDRRLSLDQLAARSGVSRSMISLIERGESSPTAVVLERLATGLGVTMASMFDKPPAEPSPGPVCRREDQPEWKDPASGYVRRNVSPAATGNSVQIVDVRFPPRRRVAFESGSRLERVSQQIWVLDGQMIITVGRARHHLRTGDCLAMELTEPTMFYNPASKPARYAVVMSTARSAR